jgi:hypothetical protein
MSKKLGIKVSYTLHSSDKLEFDIDFRKPDRYLKIRIASDATHLLKAGFAPFSFQAVLLSLHVSFTPTVSIRF